jgi:hypothetical protein
VSTRGRTAPWKRIGTNDAIYRGPRAAAATESHDVPLRSAADKPRRSGAFHALDSNDGPILVALARVVDLCQDVRRGYDGDG